MSAIDKLAEAIDKSAESWEASQELVRVCVRSKANIVAERDELRRDIEREEASHNVTIGQRDYATEKADEMAAILASLIDPEADETASVIGEHSNLNCPWQQAIDRSGEIKKSLPCGHPAELLSQSVESDYQVCRLCDCQHMLRDSNTHVKALISERDEWKRRAEAAEADIANAVRQTKEAVTDYPWKENHQSPASQAAWAACQSYLGVSKACDELQSTIAELRAELERVQLSLISQANTEFDELRNQLADSQQREREAQAGAAAMRGAN